MKVFVFRNNTVERFFPDGYEFSGYEDISSVPEADIYVWFYQQPFQTDISKVVSEIESYKERLSFVLTKIDNARTVIALTIADIYRIKYTDGDGETSAIIASYNEELRKLAKEYSNLKIIDFGDFVCKYSVEQIFDWKYYFISQMGINPRLSLPFKEWWCRKMESIKMNRKKCLVLDLDNTLWGGILGEDGIDGIKTSGDYPGKAYHAFQLLLKELVKRGVVLAICSKNNEDEVWQAIEENHDIVLKKEDFVSWRINWADKASNVLEIQKELNIGLDSMVFVDDNPAERELIRQQLPEVEVPEFPDQPYDLVTFAKNLIEKYFKVYDLTDEDREKTKQYKENARRAQVKGSYSDLGEYIKSLEIKLKISEVNEFTIQRAAQMTQKTNQFNLTTKRYTESDLESMRRRGWNIYTLGVTDKFGDYGITGLMIMEAGRIDELLLSCRILGKEIEFAFLKTVLKKKKEENQNKIEATYMRTIKNSQVADFYDRAGMNLVEFTDDCRKYKCDLNDMNLDIKDYYQISID